jgi:hypothetical protein
VLYAAYSIFKFENAVDPFQLKTYNSTMPWSIYYKFLCFQCYAVCSILQWKNYLDLLIMGEKRLNIGLKPGYTQPWSPKIIAQTSLCDFQQFGILKILAWPTHFLYSHSLTPRIHLVSILKPSSNHISFSAAHNEMSTEIDHCQSFTP